MALSGRQPPPPRSSADLQLNLGPLLGMLNIPLSAAQGTASLDRGDLFRAEQLIRLCGDLCQHDDGDRSSHSGWLFARDVDLERCAQPAAGVRHCRGSSDGLDLRGQYQPRVHRNHHTHAHPPAHGNRDRGHPAQLDTARYHRTCSSSSRRLGGRRGRRRPQLQLRRGLHRQMSDPFTLIAGAALGHRRRISPGAPDPPRTRRGGDSVALAQRGRADCVPLRHAPPRIGRAQGVALAGVSGLLLAYVLYRVGWSLNALPPLLLLVGLVQLAYCDLTRRLLPKTLVYALTIAVVASGVLVAVGTGEWTRPGPGDPGRGGVLRALLRRQPDEPALDGLRRRAPLPRLRLRPGLGEPDRPLRGVPLRQPAGVVRRSWSSWPPTGPTAGPRSPSASSWHWGPRWSSSPSAEAPVRPPLRSGQVRSGQRTFTFWASSPRRPAPMVNSTVDPGAMPRRTSPCTCEWCTKRS